MIEIPDSPDEPREPVSKPQRKKRTERPAPGQKTKPPVQASLFNAPKEPKKAKKPQDPVQAPSTHVAIADISLDTTEMKYDEPTLANLKKYFKARDFQLKKEKITGKELTNEFLLGIMAKGDYWCLGRMLFIVKKCLPREIAEIYLNSIEFKLSLDRNQLLLKRIKLPARELSPDAIRSPTGGLAAERKGYGIDDMTEFYRVLKDQKMLIQTLEDFKLLILPVFYLLHGEAYDSDDSSTMTSYFAKVTKSQINIQCLKCNENTWSLNFTFEFLYHNTDEQGQPIDITVNTRGSPCHQLHYLGTHPCLGAKSTINQKQKATNKASDTKSAKSDEFNVIKHLQTYKPKKPKVTGEKQAHQDDTLLITNIL